MISDHIILQKKPRKTMTSNDVTDLSTSRQRSLWWESASVYTRERRKKRGDDSEEEQE